MEATVDTGSTLKIEYADANGKLHSVDVEYKGDKAGADKNATAVADALAKNGELSSIFDIKADGANVKFTSKVTGAAGAKVMSVSSTDNATAMLGTPTAGADAKVTVNGLGRRCRRR